MEFGVNPDCYYGYDIASNFSNCGQLLDFMRKHFAIQKYCTSNSYQNGCIPDYHGVEKVYQDNNAGKTEDEAKSATTNCDGFWTNNIKSSTGFITNDGTIFIMYNQGFVALYLVDVNGFKGPNKWGYDLRTFTLSKNLKGNMKYMPRYCTQVEKGGKSTKDLLNI